jgi:phenylalanyl-tRNA synthetase alpha chain
LHRYEKSVLDALKEGKELDLGDLMARAGLGKDETLWALENLAANGYVSLEREESAEALLTNEGKEYAMSSLPESKLLAKLREGTVAIKNLSAQERLGFQWAKQKGFVSIREGSILLDEKGVTASERGLSEEKVLKELGKNPSAYGKLAKANRKEVAELVKRGLIEVRKKNVVAGISITKKGTAAEGEPDDDGIGGLTKSMIAGGAWKGKKFKRYDVDVPVEKAIAARKHPLAQNIDDIRRSYISNGFVEVSGPVIDSAFWVFDALFQPQDHPARDAQDTFYLEGIEEQEVKNRDFVSRVRRAHTEGWNYKWDIETAMEPVLRTHMTSVSAHYIYNILSEAEKHDKEFPIKLFSVGRVFRNENIDYRHLADFYHTDGIIIGRDLTFANLFDTLIKLYSWLGAEIKFKPAYFPFVEPGVEVYAFSKSLNEWIEFGGAGMMRTEITGVKRSSLNVLAWGVAVERLMQIRKNGDVKSITELYNNGLGWLRNRKLM